MSEEIMRKLDGEGRMQEIYTDPLTGNITRLVGPNDTVMTYTWDGKRLLEYTQLEPIPWRRVMTRKDIGGHNLTIVSLFKDGAGVWQPVDDSIKVLANSTGIGELNFELKAIEERNPLLLKPMEIRTEYIPWFDFDPRPHTGFYTATYHSSGHGDYRLSEDKFTQGRREFRYQLLPLRDPVLTIFPKEITLE